MSNGLACVRENAREEALSFLFSSGMIGRFGSFCFMGVMSR